MKIAMMPVGWPLALLTVFSIGCASTRAARQAESFERARSVLARVENRAELVETVHTDPRVLEATGMFLSAVDTEHLTPQQMSDRFLRLFPVPPWEWVPAIAFTKVEPRLHLVAISQAFAGTPSSLYLFDDSRYVKIDSGSSGTVQVEKVVVEGDRLEVMYYRPRRQVLRS